MKAQHELQTLAQKALLPRLESAEALHSRRARITASGCVKVIRQKALDLSDTVT